MYELMMLLGLVRAGIAGDRSSGDLLSASCNLQLSYVENPKAAINILLYPRIAYDEYDEHAKRIYIAKIDKGPNIVASYTVAIQIAFRSLRPYEFFEPLFTGILRNAFETSYTSDKKARELRCFIKDTKIN
jgi:hypothetical protein